ncbi:MAG: diguanylate cyclase [Bacteroidota bacterium]
MLNKGLKLFNRSYFYGVIFAGLLVAVMVFWRSFTLATLTSPTFWILTLLGLVTELITVPLPQGGRLTASFAVIFASLLMQGLLPTIMILTVVSIIGGFFIQRRHWPLSIFNFSQYTLAYSAAFWILGLADYSVLSVPRARDLPIILFAAIIYLLVNIALVNGYIALEKKVSIAQVLWEDDRWELLFTLVEIPIAVLMVILYRSLGLLGICLVLAPMLVSAIMLMLMLQMRQSRQELSIANQELSILHQVAQKIGSQIDLEQTLILIAQETKRVVFYHECRIFLVEENGKLVSRATGDSFLPSKPLELSPGEGIIGQVAQQNQALLIDGASAQLPPEAFLERYQSLLAVPILSEDRVLGVITLLHREQKAFTQADQRLLTILASQAAVAIKNAKLYHATQQLAITDGLTGVYNRRYFQRQLEAELQRAPRYGYPIALIILDVDYFKRFNDTHGHLLGDQILRSLAQILRESVRETDLVARYGGEEFAVILPETNAEQAVEVAERIRKNVAEHSFWGRAHAPVSVTVSIGIAANPTANLSAEELIGQADAALYHAKQTGRDRICCTSNKGDEPITVTQSRLDTNRPRTRRQPNRARTSVDVNQWQTHLVGLKDTIANDWWASIQKSELSLGEVDFNRWRELIGELLTHMGEEFAAGTDYPVGLTSQELMQLPIFPTIREEITQVIQKGLTLTQSENLVLTLCNLIQHQIQIAPFSPQDRLLILAVTERTIHHLQLAVSQVWHEFYQQTNNHLLALHQLEQRTSNAYDIDELLNEAVQIAAEALAGEICFLFMPDPSTEFLRIKASWGAEEGEVYQWQMPMHQGVIGQVMSQREPINVPDLAADERTTQPFFKKFQSWSGVHSALFIPLVHQGSALGVLACFSKDIRHFTPAEVRLGRGITGQLAAALERMRLEDNRQEMYLDAISALVETLEAKDSYTRGHSENLARYASRMGEVLGLSDDELDILKQASQLHDIGKIGIPDAILLKPAKLDAYERSLIETHPEVGARILSSISALKDVIPAVRHHHEHYNGTGYPDGMKGDDIPLLARILAVADAFDGMTTNRPYRSAMTREAALFEMRRCGHFDPTMIEILSKTLEE